MLNLLLSLIFPQRCLWCGKNNVRLCEVCLKDAKKDSPFYIGDTHVFPVFKYQDQIRKAIHFIKYKYEKGLIKILANENKYDFKVGVLIPVPSHWYKKNSRGFNQAEELAKIWSEKLNLPVCFDLIKKIKITDSQMGLNKSKRKNNLTDVFTFDQKYAGKFDTAIIVDDVITTGSTIKEITGVLKANGFKKISALIAARVR